jgi:hypothetical protein
VPAARWVSLVHFIAEVLIVIPAFFVYFLVRGLVEGEEAEAINRAVDVIELEQTLGIFWEPDLQQKIIDSNLLINLANWTYIWGHWPVIASVALWLFFFHRPNYPIYRNAFIISGAIGMIIFFLLPTAPPRMLEAWGFVDTVTERSEAYRTFQPPAFVNQYAAMPSLHFGWNLLVSIAVVRHASAIGVKLLGLVMPVASFLAIILTAHHFFLDGIVGGMLALFGLAAAIAISLRNSDWRSTQPPPHTTLG